MADATELEMPVSTPEADDALFTEEDIDTDYDETDEETESSDDVDNENYDGEDTDADAENTENEEATEDEEETPPATDEKTVRQEITKLTEEGDACAELLAQHNLDYTALASEYKETGELSEASRKALNDAGFSDKLIKGYIEGQQARYETSYVAHIQNIAGGSKAYNQLLDWADKNLTEAETARFDKAVESNDLDIATLAVENLIAKLASKKGTPPQLVRGRTARQPAGIRGFASLEEMAAAQDDPRYEIDREYTRKVERRMLASDF